MKENVSVHGHKSHSLSPLCLLLACLCHATPTHMHTHAMQVVEKRRKDVALR